MALIVTCVKFDSSEVQIKESFLNFFPLHRKNANEIIKSILDELQQNGLDIIMCRSQAYDNASTMAGIRFGVQCRIKQVNSKAILMNRTDDQHGLGSKPICAILLCSWERHFTALSLLGGLDKQF